MNWQHIFGVLDGEMASGMVEPSLVRELNPSPVLGSVTSLGPVELE